MNRNILLLMLLGLALVLSGCTRSAATPDTPDLVLPTVTPALPGLPSVTPAVVMPTVALLSTPTVAPTAGVFSPFEVKAGTNNLNVRTGPGKLFPALMMVNQGDFLKVFGISPGGEWLDVETASGARGWVFLTLIEMEADFSSVPQVEPGNVVKITGQVLDGQGVPIKGVQFAFVQGSGRTDAQTDDTGWYYAFLPSGSRGSWDVSYVAIACDSNVWVDTACSSYKPGYIGTTDPNVLTITLPLVPEGPLNFTWK
jgi:hypothetical protein